jgi:hypothetical protein
MMTRIAPTVGRKLYFYPGEDKSVHRFDDQPIDATIIYVWPQAPTQEGQSDIPQLLNLHVIDHTGTQQTKTSVPLIQDGEDVPSVGNYAMWMPFQVGQAKAQNEPGVLQVAPFGVPVPQTLDQLLVPSTQTNPGLTQNTQQGSQYTPSFQGALSALKDGRRVARAGWNGKGMFLYLVPANSYPAQTGAAKAYFGENALVPYGAYLAMKTAQENVVPWLASQTDILAEDWEVLL